MVDSSRGSSLCLNCGICCQGVFFHQDEDPRRYGLDPNAVGNGRRDQLLPLSCLLYREGRCLVHEEPARQPCCRESRCRLLKRLLSGEISVEQARTIGGNIKALIAGIMAELPGDRAARPALDLMDDELSALRREMAAGDRSRVALFMEITSLMALIERHILPFEGVVGKT